MCNFAHHRMSLKPAETEKWIDRGGSMLGMRRERGPKSGTDLAPEELAAQVLYQLQDKDIDILYVIGGGGGLAVAIENVRQRIVVGDTGERALVGVGSRH